MLEASVLYDGAKVGDVTRAEAEFDVEGITILSVVAPQGKRAEKKVERIEIKGSSKGDFQGVTSQLVDKKKRSPNKKGRPEGGRPDGKGGEGNKDRGDRDRKRSDRGPRRERPERPARPTAPSHKKLIPGDTNRQAVLGQLAPEQRPIAEQVLRGGIPAVRQAIEAENTKAKAEGRPEIPAAGLIALAEELLPQLKTAEWMDRAQAAKTDVDAISVRDLRAVVAGADAVARTDEARVLASELRNALDRRTQEERERWTKDIATSLDENRVIRALRLAARPPDAQTKFPAELLERLKTAADQAMSPETTSERWLTLIEAVAASPVRRSVEPVGLPAEPGDELLNAAKAAAGRIPALAKQLGVTMPPPPPVRKPAPPKPASAAAQAPSEAPAPVAESKQPSEPEAPPAAVEPAPTEEESAQ